MPRDFVGAIAVPLTVKARRWSPPEAWRGRTQGPLGADGGLEGGHRDDAGVLPGPARPRPRRSAARRLREGAPGLIRGVGESFHARRASAAWRTGCATSQQRSRPIRGRNSRCASAPAIRRRRGRSRVNWRPASAMTTPTSFRVCFGVELRPNSRRAARAATYEPPPSTSASQPSPPPAVSTSPTKVIASPVADSAGATIAPGTQPQSAAQHRASCPLPLPALSTAWRKPSREVHQDKSCSPACPARHSSVRSPPSFRPDRRARHAGARSGGQGWPVFGPPSGSGNGPRACPASAPAPRRPSLSRPGAVRRGRPE